jgi:glycosyltransferase involved in cell wall biosynthesis
MKAFLSAYACEPGKGSEPEVGWQVAAHMAHHCRVTVVTRANNRRNIEAALAQLPEPKPHFLYYDLPRPFLWLKKRLLGASGYYILWQIAVRLRFAAEARRHDLLHHVTFNGVQIPGLWFGMRMPVLLGPLGGGMLCPAAFLPLFGPAEGSERRRGRLIGALRHLPWWRASIRQASVILAANRETANLLQPFRKERVPVLLETALSPDAILTTPRQPAMGKPFRVLWLGAWIPRKAAVLALQANALARRECPEIQLHLAGAGPEESRLRHQANRLGLAEDGIRFLGRIPKAEVTALMDASHAFLFTSIRDTSGNVVLEAMSRGLPVVTLWHQGMREICTPDTALCIEPTDPEDTVRALAKALQDLCKDPAKACQLGEAGRQRVQETFLWSNYSKTLHQHYQHATAGKSAL